MVMRKADHGDCTAECLPIKRNHDLIVEKLS